MDPYRYYLKHCETLISTPDKHKAYVHCFDQEILEKDVRTLKEEGWKGMTNIIMGGALGILFTSATAFEEAGETVKYHSEGDLVGALKSSTMLATTIGGLFLVYKTMHQGTMETLSDIYAPKKSLEKFTRFLEKAPPEMREALQQASDINQKILADEEAGLDTPGLYLIPLYDDKNWEASINNTLPIFLHNHAVQRLQAIVHDTGRDPAERHHAAQQLNNMGLAS